MLSIRPGTANDVPLLKTFFQEFAEYERLSTVITEEQLRQRLRDHVQCPRLEHGSDRVLPKSRRHIFRRLENRLPQTKSAT